MLLGVLVAGVLSASGSACSAVLEPTEESWTSDLKILQTYVYSNAETFYAKAKKDVKLRGKLTTVSPGLLAMVDTSRDASEFKESSQKSLEKVLTHSELEHSESYYRKGFSPEALVAFTKCVSESSELFLVPSEPHAGVVAVQLVWRRGSKGAPSTSVLVEAIGGRFSDGSSRTQVAFPQGGSQTLILRGEAQGAAQKCYGDITIVANSSDTNSDEVFISGLRSVQRVVRTLETCDENDPCKPRAGKVLAPVACLRSGETSDWSVKQWAWISNTKSFLPHGVTIAPGTPVAAKIKFGTWVNPGCEKHYGSMRGDGWSNHVGSCGEGGATEQRCSQVQVAVEETITEQVRECIP